MNLETLNPIELAVPIFFLLIAVELLVGLLRRRNTYRLSDSISDLSTGLIFSIVGVGVTAGSLWLYEQARLTFSIQALLNAPAIRLAAPFWVWALVFVATDFIYYWFHRATHEIRFLWACHVTHHSSEEFNLAVALRQNCFQRVFEYMFYLPLAFIGVPWQMFFICHGMVKLYQFWVHTRHIGKLGWLEWFMLTPSHHRVHHGRDAQYLDCNYGGTFVVWDRWFGSYVEETTEPHYGIIKPLRSFDPVHASLHEYTAIARDFLKTRRWRDRLGVLVRAPGWRPADLGGPLPPPVIEADDRRFEPALARGVKVYAVLQFVLLTAYVSVFLKFAQRDPGVWLLVALGAALTLSLWSIGLLLDGRPAALRLEGLRHTLAPPVFYGLTVYLGLPAQAAVILAVIAGVSLLWTLVLRRGASAPEAVADSRLV